MRTVPVVLFALCALSVWPQGTAVKNRAPLEANSYNLLPLGSVKPKGWLKRQLQIQADGLSGHIGEFWADLGPTSGWLGGPGESWERGPYYLDGLVPLAFLLDDELLKAKVKPWVDWTLTHQRADGLLGPERNTDWWPRMVMTKFLTQYQEATGDPRVTPALERYFLHHLQRIQAEPLQSWAIYRWADELVSVLWVYNRTGNPKMLEFARLLHGQGYDWNSQFAPFPYKEKMHRGQTTLKTHVVNNAMALKTTPAWYVVARDPALKTGFYNQLAQLDRYHLQANGAHAGDEHYAGLDPSQGTELCSIVEAMFSLEHVLAIFGDPLLGDRLEKLAYNPLPGTFDKAMWAHQYDQQVNQVLCDPYPRAWTTNGARSNLFGLEPNFGCCTANMHQGWPKFVANLWMATPDDGLVAAAYGPSEVKTTVRGGLAVKITEDTEYPFRGTVKLTIAPAKPAQFPLLLRIPAWAHAAAITVNGTPVTGVKPATFHRLERRWKPGDTVEIRFPLDVRFSTWYHDSVAVERGPLVFSLKLGEEWRKVEDRPQAPDWAIYPTTPWNYGLLAKDVKVEDKPIGDYPFSPEGAPVELKMKGRLIPEWSLWNGSAGTLPQSPIESNRPLEDLTLIPYGSAKLRVTAFPQLK